jgi:hypothetical protein
MKLKTETHLACSIYTNIDWLIITPCAINDFWLVSVIESFTSWHAIEFAWIRCLCVRHPVIAHTFKWRTIKMWTLLLSKIGFMFGTVLCVTRKVLFVATFTQRFTILIHIIAFACLICDTAAARPRAVWWRAPWSPLVSVSFTTWYYEALGEI